MSHAAAFAKGWSFVIRHASFAILGSLLLAPCSLLAEAKTGVGLNKISLPSGPGSIEGLGDSFEPQLNTGTTSYSIKIASPPGVAGLQPNVVLRYNSGGGNSAFGIAWSDGLMCIQRQTEKGLPTYGASDKFTLGGEELVPLSDGSYRTENESEFRRIVRDGTGWIIYNKNGTRHFLGSKPMLQNPSRIVRPGGGETFDDTFKWFVDDVVDVNGNSMSYLYQTYPDSPGNTYCSEIRYSIFGSNYHAINFDYETRPDAFSSCLSGFIVRTGRRCHQIRVTSQGALVRRYKLGYTLPADDPIEPIGVNDGGQTFSLLRQVTQFDNGVTDNNYLPPLRLGYTRFDAAAVTRGSFVSPAPVSLANANLSIADVNCDSLPDFFYTDPVTGAHSVIYNYGFGRFSAQTPFSSQPTGIVLGQGNAELADLDGDGRIDLVLKSGGSSGIFSFFPNTTLPTGHDDTHPSWGSEKAYVGQLPGFDLTDPNVRSLDLNGDKKIDYMRTTSAGFVYYYNRGNTWEEDGIYLFGEPQMGDITYADALTFDDPNHVKLADMNGDRLLDLVRIHLFQNTLEITYWPNKGRGYWGNRTVITSTIDVGTVPIEDVFVRDINGDGLADIVAVAYDNVSYWINLGNDTFSRRFEVANTPEYIKGTTVLQQADINGNGTTDLLWENWDPSAGAYRISWVDFIGATKPNLLAVIDNGIGLRTEMSYRTSTEFYAMDKLGSNPWHTRLPFPSWCVSKISKHFGLDLDAVPGEDKYITEFSYFDGYYDTFEKEFRGFAFAKKVERGDDRLTDGGPASEVNSPSTITRFAFHTGVPDGVDNDGNNATDEFDPISGYEEEALKGKLLWTETTLLTAAFNGVDDDGDGFVDESDEGPFDGQLSPDNVVFTREYQTWRLKRLHDPSGGFTQPGASLPYATTNGQKVTYPFVASVTKQVIDAMGSLHGGNTFASDVSPAVVTTETDVDFFGNITQKREFGVTGGGASGITYDDERTTNTQYGFNLPQWIIGLPTEVSVTDENGSFVSKSRSYYDNQGFGLIGARGLMTSEEKFIGSSSTAFPAYSPNPGDPRVGAAASLTSVTQYDSYGNPTVVRDPAYAAGAGHERVYGYDSTFHTYVETETIKVGNGSADLVASAAYDKGAGVITTSTDFNSNVSSYQYDSFFRLVGIVKPGDSAGSPTQVFQYQPGDPVRSLDYSYSASGALTLSVTATSPVVSRVTVKSRETAGGGTFDIVQITDGAGHKLGTIEEGETPSQFVYKNVKRYTSRGAERDSYLPFYGGSPSFKNPPPDGDRVTDYYDAGGRVIRTVNPPEVTGGVRKATRTDYLPLKTVLFDEEDNDPLSVHFNTPHIQYKDGLDRLVGVDEINKESNTPVTYPTRYTYDLQDNLIKIVDSQNNQKWMRYDGLKRMIFMHDPDRGVMTYTYDAASNLTQTVDAKSQTIVMTYDGANRITTEDYLDARGLTPDVTYSYDTPVTVPAGDGTSVTSTQVKGKLASVTDLSGGEVLSYDARGRTAWKIKRIPDPANGQLVSYMSSFGYDSLDRLTGLTYPDSDTVGYTYNARNLPETITGGPGGFIVPDMNYIASGQLDSTSYGNGVTTSYTYDPRLRLRSLNTLRAPSSTLLAFSYQFDAASNITRIDDNRSAIPANDPRKNTQVFGYDDLYRLTSVQYPTLLSGSAGSISYAYDRIGNMLSQTSNIAATENGLPLTNLGTMSYGGSMGPSGRIGRNGSQPGPHALTAVSGGSRAYPYDDNGNMQSIDGMTCTWDFKDRLIAVENATMRADYTYDYTDRRITKKVTPKPFQISNPASDITQYVDRTFEVRPGQELVKYVWNGETRVARVTTNLNATQRIQRFALQPGWNILALAVTLSDGDTQLRTGHVDEVVRYATVTRDYHRLTSSETVPTGTLLRVHATAATTLSVRGTWSAPAAINVATGRQWLLNTRFAPLDIATALPANDPLWFWQADTQSWRTRIPLLPAASTHPAKLQPGEALFTAATAPYTISAPDPTLDIRYYHQDHLGSSSVMSDASGALVSETAFYPFGHPRQEHEPRGVKEAYGFTQKERDGETGLSYFGGRYLVSAIGRFLSVDPMCENSQQQLAKPQAFNSFTYTENNPVAHIDPDGEATWPVRGNQIVGNSNNPNAGYFGLTRNSGTKAHNGADIGAQVGDPVRAFKDGKVVRAGYENAENKKQGHGLRVVVKHEESVNGKKRITYSVYSHLSEKTVKTGQTIREGDILGKVGRTGNVEKKNETHLHFEIQEGANYPAKTKLDPSSEFSTMDKVKTFLEGVIGKGPLTIPDTQKPASDDHKH